VAAEGKPAPSIAHFPSGMKMCYSFSTACKEATVRAMVLLIPLLASQHGGFTGKREGTASCACYQQLQKMCARLV